MTTLQSGQSIQLPPSEIDHTTAGYDTVGTYCVAPTVRQSLLYADRDSPAVRAALDVLDISKSNAVSTSAHSPAMSFVNARSKGVVFATITIMVPVGLLVLMSLCGGNCAHNGYCSGCDCNSCIGMFVSPMTVVPDMILAVVMSVSGLVCLDNRNRYSNKHSGQYGDNSS